ncbi:phosphate signaling complex protein PhoU [Saccharopolyspora taberi]|uniref:Phosphate-specific transport system accessory protein PhoU n=1 Tax=Saccharopolyspora taberi TaxID=60895 RepID=A0ABN3VCY3_9PSEU
MREAFHGQLEQLGHELTGMCELAAESIHLATGALLEADLALAEQVLTDDVRLDEAGRRCEEHASTLLALQSPVATELRTILATIYCAVKLERMGDLAAHIAETTRRVHPERVLPPELEGDFRTMGELGEHMARRLSGFVSGESAEGGFAELRHSDDAVDALNASILGAVTGKDWPHDVRTAVNLALLARFYERFADQAVSVSRRLEFAVTGTLPE